MVRPHGIGNKNAIDQLANSVSGSGIMRARTGPDGNKLFDVNGPVVQLQKGLANVAGAGRLVILKGNQYIPAYTTAIGGSIGSGYTTTSPGIYQVDAVVAVSGVAIEQYTGVVLVNGVPASGTASFGHSNATGASAVKINGIVHANAGSVINVGVKSLHGNITTIGVEELVHAPAANLRIIKLGSDELPFTG